MPLLVWNENLVIEIPSMDSQHQQWIGLMNDLHEAVQKGEDLVYPILIGMIEYTNTHFKDEEELLYELDYPDYAHHKQLHDAFIGQLEELQNELPENRQADWLSTMKVIRLLSDWFSHHIKSEDRKYASFLKEKGVQ